MLQTHLTHLETISSYSKETNDTKWFKIFDTSTMIIQSSPSNVVKEEITVKEKIVGINEVNITKTDEEILIKGNITKMTRKAIDSRPKSRHNTSCPMIITKEEFEAIPSYMKGRFKLGEINDFFEKIHFALIKKYEFFENGSKPGNFKKLGIEMQKLYREYKSSANLIPCQFVTQHDINRYAHAKLDKKNLQCIVILRHLKRVKEFRNKGGKEIKYAID
ncbi:unnamed protein product [Gordionus sp. m RMFG-2023]